MNGLPVNGDRQPATPLTLYLYGNFIGMARGK
jgi:hypothetical protein